jgi:putative membrane protein insertion efficiency factor
MGLTALEDFAGNPALARGDELRGRGILARALVALIHSYRRHAPQVLRASCRYEPTCSEYAIVAIQRYGAVRGGSRAFRRLMRCRPPYGGFDEP